MDTKPIGALAPENVERAGITLAHTFETDPMFEWMFPDTASRPSLSLAAVRPPIRTRPFQIGFGPFGRFLTGQLAGRCVGNRKNK